MQHKLIWGRFMPMEKNATTLPVHSAQTWCTWASAMTFGAPGHLAVPAPLKSTYDNFLRSLAHIDDITAAQTNLSLW